MKKSNNFKKMLVFGFTALYLSVVFSIGAYAQMLVPIGKAIGITVSVRELKIVQICEFTDISGNNCCPSRDAGLIAGDILKKIGSTEIVDTKCLEEAAKKSDGNAQELVYTRNGREFSTRITPRADISDKKYRYGFFVKNSESGIGTLTYCDPTTGKFGALGHGISRPDEEVLAISDGEILKTEITSIKQGERGIPGELTGVFTDSESKIGTVEQNCETGVFGQLDNKNMFGSDTIPTAERNEVHEGNAKIFSNIDGSEKNEYEIEIDRINSDEDDSKSFIIKITDKDLLEKTGGIVQGMSGSPIIQDGKLVGAITHVFVNDPTRGYGIFIGNMTDKTN